MEDQYGMADLRQLVSGRTNFPDVQLAADLFSGHNQYEMLMMGHHLVGEMMQPREFSSDYSTLPGASISAAPGGGGGCSITQAMDTTGGPPPMDLEHTCLAGDGGTGRWPRQETLALLAIRTRMDHSFKEANQKGPLWEEVSRALIKEFGYNRHPKKCKEKFENLYKYYKKTKDGKAGRQDGKHYRFFRQLEALNGETSGIGSSEARVNSINNPFHHASAINRANVTMLPHTQSSISQSTSSEFDTSSSDDDDLNDNALTEEMEKTNKRKHRVSWKMKLKEFIDTQMKRLVRKQEAWLERILQTIEEKEDQRAIKEKEWRKRESDRIAEENRIRACDRDWIKTKIIEALQNINTSREIIPSNSEELMVSDIQHDGENVSENINSAGGEDFWPHEHVTTLTQLRCHKQPRFERNSPEEEDGKKEEDNYDGTIWGHIAEDMGDGNSFISGHKWNPIEKLPTKSIQITEGSIHAEEISPSQSNSNCDRAWENNGIKFINQRKR